MLRRLLAFLAIVVACVVGGALECRYPVLSPEAQSGKDTYVRMCAVCHGSSGEGYVADHAPALAHSEFQGTVSDEFLRHAIEQGRSGTTMTPWGEARGGPLSAPELDDLVTYLRTWRRPLDVTLDEKPLGGDVARGEVIYARDCVKCHGAKGRGGPNPHIGNQDLLQHASNGFLRHAIRNGRSGTAMPAFGATLGEQGVEDLVALLRSYARPAPPTFEPPPKAEPIPLGPVPLNPNGPDPKGFTVHPKGTRSDVVKAELDRGARMAILDARGPPAYIMEHIAGSVSVPFYDPNPYFAALPKDTWLVCYCSCPHAESRSLAQKLLDAGFPKVTVLEEGLGYWKSKKYATSKGTSP